MGSNPTLFPSTFLYFKAGVHNQVLQRGGASLLRYESLIKGLQAVLLGAKQTK